jgi:nitroreductase
MAELMPALAKRRASRAFADRPVADGLLKLLWQAMIVAPSHGNTQPTRILVPDSSEQRARLFGALSEGNRTWAGAAPVLAAIVSIPEHSGPARNWDGSTREMWALNTGIAIGNLMAQATELGLIAHPMAGFDEATVRTVFGAPDSVRIVAVAAIGWPGDPASLPEDLQERERSPQERIELDRFVVRGSWTDRHGESARAPRGARG